MNSGEINALLKVYQSYWLHWQKVTDNSIIFPGWWNENRAINHFIAALSLVRVSTVSAVAGMTWLLLLTATLATASAQLPASFQVTTHSDCSQYNHSKLITFSANNVLLIHFRNNVKKIHLGELNIEYLFYDDLYNLMQVHFSFPIPVRWREPMSSTEGRTGSRGEPWPSRLTQHWADKQINNSIRNIVSADTQLWLEGTSSGLGSAVAACPARQQRTARTSWTNMGWM